MSHLPGSFGSLGVVGGCLAAAAIAACSAVPPLDLSGDNPSESVAGKPNGTTGGTGVGGTATGGTATGGTGTGGTGALGSGGTGTAGRAASTGGTGGTGGTTGAGGMHAT